MKIKAETSNHHIHISEEDFKVLFGEDAQLTVRKMLGKEEFASNEFLTIEGERGSISGIRILGPYRKQTQVELLSADCRCLGIAAPVAESVSSGTAGAIKMIGPCGTLIKEHAAIIAHRHVHLNEDVGRRQMGLEEGQMVKVRISGDRGLVFDNVIVRMHKGPLCVVHLDAEEGNAAGLRSGDTVDLIKD